MSLNSSGLNFNADLLQAIAQHRTPLAMVFFQLFSWLGEIEGYILVGAVIHAAFEGLPDRRDCTGGVARCV